MTLNDYRNKSKKTLQQIADDIKMDNSTVFRIIDTPWRTTIKSFLMVAAYLGMPEIEARKEWLNSKIKYQQKMSKKKIKQWAMEVE